VRWGVRLIDRSDTSLAIALVASALVIFHQPLRILVDAAHDVEVRYHIDLLPGLTVLVATFGFHQYRKRQQARAAETAASLEAAQARARSAELERLVAFGRALGNALDLAAARQVFWRYMPAFAGERELWMMLRKADGWEPPVKDATAPSERTPEALEALANEVLTSPERDTLQGEGIFVHTDLCIPMVVGESTVGVLGIRNTPAISPSERHALGAAAALLAIAIRNSQLIAETRENSIRDGLTGCFNRTYALEAIATELKRARRTRRPLALLMFDIDQFKMVNDEYGHLAGDAILSAIGARLLSMLRASDVKCRSGGDEFLVILPDTELSGAQHVATSLLDALSELRITVNDRVLSPTISIGVTVSQHGELDARVVIASADKALYDAKRAGRNRYVASELAHASA
jgi:diguanylate cyclase (GGDEF)-like protein